MVSLYRIEHLGLNVVLQLLVGVPLEMVHGATRIGLVYVAGVVAGRQVGPKFIGDTSPQWLGIPMGWGKSQASRRPRTFITEAPDYKLFGPDDLPISPGKLERELPPREGGM